MAKDLQQLNSANWDLNVHVTRELVVQSFDLALVLFNNLGQRCAELTEDRVSRDIGVLGVSGSTVHGIEPADGVGVTISTCNATSCNRVNRKPA